VTISHDLLQSSDPGPNERSKKIWSEPTSQLRDTVSSRALLGHDPEGHELNLYRRENLESIFMMQSSLSVRETLNRYKIS